MPEKKTLAKAARAKREGKAPSTQAGAFVEEEMEHAKEGKHEVKNRKQAIAIGLSKARRAGVNVPAKKRSSRSTSRSKSRSSSGRSRSKSGSSKRKST